jgi:uncharacterized protein
MRFFAMVFVLGLALVAPAEGTPSPISFGQAHITVGSAALQVQVARTPTQMERGLMFRESVAPFDGMLFVFDVPQPVNFWMKNTRLPLEVGYFDNTGTLVEIHAMKPFDTTPTPSRSLEVRYALELPAGNLDRRGIHLGDKLVLPSAMPRLDSSLPNF